MLAAPGCFMLWWTRSQNTQRTAACNEWSECPCPSRTFEDGHVDIGADLWHMAEPFCNRLGSTALCWLQVVTAVSTGHRRNTWGRHQGHQGEDRQNEEDTQHGCACNKSRWLEFWTLWVYQCNSETTFAIFSNKCYTWESWECVGHKPELTETEWKCKITVISLSLGFILWGTWICVMTVHPTATELWKKKKWKYLLWQLQR